MEIKVLDERVREWSGGSLALYHSAGAAAFDLYACLDRDLVIEPQAPPRAASASYPAPASAKWGYNNAVLVPAGISIHIANSAIVGLILPRSGLGHNTGLVMGNGTGVIDSDYTGPLHVSVCNRTNEPLLIRPGMRIAQMLFVPAVRPAFTEVSEFSVVTARGASGFGSTGA